MEEAEPGSIQDIYGRLLAIEHLLTTVMASQAKTFPNGAVAQTLDDPQHAIEIYGQIDMPDGGVMKDGYLTAALRRSLAEYLGRAARIRDSWHQEPGGE